MRALARVCLALSLAFSGTVSGADKYDPYLIDKRVLKKEYRRIALAPVEAGSALAMPDLAKEKILALVSKHLEKRKFIVTPSSALADIRKTMVEQVGGLASSESDELDAAKAAAVLDHSWRELWFRHEIDAVATVRIDIIQAPVENDKAEWDGVTQKLQKKGRLKYTASVAASTVTLSIRDQRQQPLFLNYGGLEVLMMRDGSEMKPLDPSSYFQDEKRLTKAVSLALKPI